MQVDWLPPLALGSAQSFLLLRRLRLRLWWRSSAMHWRELLTLSMCRWWLRWRSNAMPRRKLLTLRWRSNAIPRRKLLTLSSLIV